MNTTSGFLKSTTLPVRAETALPTSRFTSDLKGSGSASDRSLQTISSFSAISGGTRQPTRKVANSRPFTASTTRSAQRARSVKEVPADPAGAREFLVGLVLCKGHGDLQSPPAFIIGEAMRPFPEEPPEAVSRRSRHTQGLLLPVRLCPSALPPVQFVVQQGYRMIGMQALRPHGIPGQSA